MNARTSSCRSCGPPELLYYDMNSQDGRDQPPFAKVREKEVEHRKTRPCPAWVTARPRYSRVQPKNKPRQRGRQRGLCAAQYSLGKWMTLLAKYIVISSSGKSVYSILLVNTMLSLPPKATSCRFTMPLQLFMDYNALQPRYYPLRFSQWETHIAGGLTIILILCNQFCCGGGSVFSTPFKVDCEVHGGLVPPCYSQAPHLQHRQSTATPRFFTVSIESPKSTN